MNKQFQEQLFTEEFADILGQALLKRDLKSALLAQRHILLIGPPGVGKTTLVRNLVKLLPGKEQHFVRVQGSPDLTAEDLLGDIDPQKALQYGPLSIEAFQKGKIFKAHKGILFFDEVNRCSEKLQNALLQALEERKVTIGSYDVDFDADIIFIGTMNPDDNSTEPLSDVFLDRFDVLRMTYPETQNIEQEIVLRYGKKLALVPEHLLESIVTYVRALRSDERLEKLPSVRATLGLYDRSQSNALLNNRTTVNDEDLGRAVESVIAHRIRLKPSVQFLMSPEEFIQKTYEKHAQENLVGGGP